MQDLNRTMFYKAKFTISSEVEEDLLWLIVKHIYTWQTQKWNRNYSVLTTDLKLWTGLKFGNKKIFSFENPNNDVVYIASSYYRDELDDSEYWACDIMEKPCPKPGLCGREWHTEIGFEKTDDNQAVFSCVLTYGDIPGFIGPTEGEPSLTTPRLVTNIINDPSVKTEIGIDQLQIHAIRLSAGSWPSFKQQLQNPTREVPYVFINSMDSDEERDSLEFLVDPERLARLLCGNAIVYCPRDIGLVREMLYWDDEYRCGRGYLTVFYPANEGEQVRKRFLNPKQVEEYTPQGTEAMLRHALAQDVNFYDTFFRIENCQKLIEKRRVSQRVQKLKESHENDTNSLFDELIQLENEKNEAQRIAEREINERRNIEADNSRLSIRIEELTAIARQYNKLSNAVQSRKMVDSYPDTVESVVDYFTKSFADSLFFTETAIKSLKTCTLRLDDLWKTLWALAIYMKPIFEEGYSDPYKEFQQKTGIKCARGEGSMTRKDKVLMRQFSCDYKGTQFNIEPHITFPSQKQSIHFNYDYDDHLIVIGHCGEHLKIYSSKNFK